MLRDKFNLNYSDIRFFFILRQWVQSFSIIWQSFYWNDGIACCKSQILYFSRHSRDWISHSQKIRVLKLSSAVQVSFRFLNSYRIFCTLWGRLDSVCPFEIKSVHYISFGYSDLIHFDQILLFLPLYGIEAPGSLRLLSMGVNVPTQILG